MSHFSELITISIPARLLRILNHLTPSSRLKDRIAALAKFLKHHKRYPTNEMLFSNVLYRIKCGPDILDPARSFTTDKELAKIFVDGVLGAARSVPTLGVIKSRSELLAFPFPDRCFIKAAHASGMNIFRKNGEPIDFDAASSWLKKNYYDSTREGNYRDLKPKIIVELPIFDGREFYELRVFCWNGEVKIIYRQRGDKKFKKDPIKRRVFTADWRDLACSIGYPIDETVAERPKKLDEIVAACEKIAAYFSFVRVDVYTDDTEFLIGEITHNHASASQGFVPPDAESRVSKLIFEQHA